MAIIKKLLSKPVNSDANVGLLLGGLYPKLWQMKQFMQQAVGCWQNQGNCNGLLSSLASCLPTQPASCAVRELNVSSDSLQEVVSLKVLKRYHLQFSQLQVKRRDNVCSHILMNAVKVQVTCRSAFQL